MSLLDQIQRLLRDPPPLYVFEVNEHELMAVRRDSKTLEIAATAYRELPREPAAEPAAGRAGLPEPEVLHAAVKELTGELGPSRRDDAAVILPDACARLSVLDFDHLPGDHRERERLIRWRLKKAVPFDVEQARLAFTVQRAPGGAAVLAAVTPAEIVDGYESALRGAGLTAAYLSTSTAAALNLVREPGAALLANLAGHSMTMAAVQNETVRLIRSVELTLEEDPSPDQMLEEMVADLYPTLVFVADSLDAPVNRVWLAGFGSLAAAALERLPGELGCDVALLEGPKGPVQERDAGLWGFLSMN